MYIHYLLGLCILYPGFVAQFSGIFLGGEKGEATDCAITGEYSVNTSSPRIVCLYKCVERGELAC